MKNAKSVLFAFLLLFAGSLLKGPALCQDTRGRADDLNVKWEELTSPDFALAVARSGGTCVIPMGILEKHGPHLPLGTDLLDAREAALRAARKEYTIVFAPYYFGQIFEARHQPGTVAYSQKLMWDVLQETCDELARNGIKKIILLSGHGGNSSFLPFFCQAQLANRKDYVVYLFQPPRDTDFDAQVKKMRRTSADGHAGETETSMVMAHRPDLVRLDHADDESGENQNRLAGIPGLYTGIWWYAAYPNHYAGDGRAGNAKLGEILIEHQAVQLAAAIKAAKADQSAPELQKRFFDQAENPTKKR